jgi:amino acid transporter
MLFAYSFDGILPEWITKVNKNGCPWVALIVAMAGSSILLAWGIFGANFFIVLAYATLVQLIGMILVGVAAFAVPYTRPDLFRASTSQVSFLGIPLVQIAGVFATLSGVIIWAIYLGYPSLGISASVGGLALLTGGTVAVAVLYFVALRVKKGGRLAYVYREIPPE